MGGCFFFAIQICIAGLAERRDKITFKGFFMNRAGQPFYGVLSISMTYTEDGFPDVATSFLNRLGE